MVHLAGRQLPTAGAKPLILRTEHPRPPPFRHQGDKRALARERRAIASRPTRSEQQWKLWNVGLGSGTAFQASWPPCLLLRVKPSKTAESGRSGSHGRTPPDSGRAGHRGGTAGYSQERKLEPPRHHAEQPSMAAAPNPVTGRGRADLVIDAQLQLCEQSGAALQQPAEGAQVLQAYTAELISGLAASRTVGGCRPPI